MRVVEIANDRSLVVTNRPVPPLGPGEVRVDVAYCGICGSDLQMCADPDFPAGRVLGHEFAGRISEIGDGVDGWAVGDRVAVLIYRFCGTCRYCAGGDEHFCVSGGHLGWVLGVQGQGGYAESVVAPASSLFAVPDGVTDMQAALTEPVAVALRAANFVECPPNEPVAVFGAGPVGLLIALILRYKGFTDVTVLERNPARRAAAERVGFRTAVVETDDDQARLASTEPAVVVDATGAASAIKTAIQVVRDRGRIVLVGLPAADVPVDVNRVILHEINLVGSAGYNRADFAAALDLLATGAIPTDALITNVADLSVADEKFKELLNPFTRQVKILLQP